LNEIDVYEPCEIVWSSRNDCVIDCVDSWLSFDRAGWQLIAKVARAKELYGASILSDIAEMRHQSVHTLQNWMSTWNSPVRQKAIELDLSPGHVDAIAGIAATDAEQAEDYLQVAAEKGLPVVALRRYVAGSGSTETQRTFPTSGTIRDDAPAVIDEQRTGVWIRNDMTPAQVYDELTQIFSIDWTERFVNLVAKGEIE
jgi:hypothetical protein